MAKITFKIKGLDKIQKKLGAQGRKEVLKDISNEMRVKANDIRTLAIQRAPVNTGILRAGIEVEGKDLKWIIYAVAEYAGYVEFGTKTKVRVPNEMKEVAAEFRGKRKGYDEFKKAISEWMRSKGIPEQALWPIMAKIMNVGIAPQPFMWPAFDKVSKEIENDINRVIQRYLDK